MIKKTKGLDSQANKSEPEKHARIIRGGNFPLSQVYAKEGRATRDLMCRRTHLVQRRAEALTHIRLVHYQRNLPKPSVDQRTVPRSGTKIRL